jgi:Glycosyltransferases involved in cell wall biogenesis
MVNNMTLIKPLVSVYMPTYNRLELLKKAVASVISQTFTDWELIIVNDCSSDDTESYLKELVAEDDRISFYTNKASKGACFSRNLAIDKSKGKYITGLDDDDVFTNDRLAILLENYETKYAFVSTDWSIYPNTLLAELKKTIIYKNGVICLEELLDKNHVGNQVFTEKSKLIELGGFDESLPAWQDYDMWVRLVENYGSALKLKSKTQKILVTDNINRITNSTKRVEGIQRFLTKHQSLMNFNQVVRIKKIIAKIS